MDALDRIANEKSHLDTESKQLKADLDLWDMDCENLRNRELQFVKGLDDHQLTLYSDYEDSSKTGSIGKKELCARNLTKSLSREQQQELIHLSQSASSLENRRTALERKNQEIAQGREKNYRDLTILMQVAESYYGRRGRSNFSDVLYTAQQSMQQWQRAIEMNQQRLEVYRVNRSLQDIANALQDLKY